MNFISLVKINFINTLIIRLDTKTKHLQVVLNMSREWQLRSGLSVAARLLAVKLRTMFYATSEKGNNLITNFLNQKEF